MYIHTCVHTFCFTLFFTGVFNLFHFFTQASDSVGLQNYFLFFTIFIFLLIFHTGVGFGRVAELQVPPEGGVDIGQRKTGTKSEKYSTPYSTCTCH